MIAKPNQLNEWVINQMRRRASSSIDRQGHAITGGQVDPYRIAAAHLQCMMLMGLENVRTTFNGTFQVFTEKHRSADLGFEDVGVLDRFVLVQDDALRSAGCGKLFVKFQLKRYHRGRRTGRSSPPHSITFGPVTCSSPGAWTGWRGHCTS